MLEQILDYIHNYFEKEKYSGVFRILDNTLVIDSLQDGQYFKVSGSVFNDGVHQYPSDPLVDEEFEGEIWAMAVPPAVIALSNEINDWVTKYGDVMNGPFQSESFGGYSYTKGSQGGSGGTTGTSDWRYVFRSRLNHWRKIS